MRQMCNATGTDYREVVASECNPALQAVLKANFVVDHIFKERIANARSRLINLLVCLWLL